jgi:CO/xanthine dehydrogenase FAD-binding subunit
MSRFRYVSPPTLQDALQTLNATNHLVMPLAGGTRILVALHQETIQPELLVDLRHLNELKQIEYTTHSVKIGALVTLAQIEQHPLIQQHVPLLAEMAKSFAHPHVRAAATLGGNIATATTMITDAIVPLLTLDASLVLHNSRHDTDMQQRSLSIADYIQQKPDPGEIITQITIPVLPLPSYSYYYKVGNRKAAAPTIASIATYITIQHQKIIKARIVLGGLTALPFCAQRTETVLLGEMLPLRESTIIHCLKMLEGELPEPLQDSQASSSYRAMLGNSLVKKALKQMRPVDEK